MIAEAGNFSETLCAVHAQDLDIVVPDLSMSARDGIEREDYAKAIRPAAKVLSLLEV